METTLKTAPVAEPISLDEAERYIRNKDKDQKNGD